MNTRDIDTVRRGNAAMNLLISGPTFLGALDPAYVLPGAGTGFTETEKRQFSAKLIHSNRSMVFQEYSMKAGKLA